MVGFRNLIDKITVTGKAEKVRIKFQVLPIIYLLEFQFRFELKYD